MGGKTGWQKFFKNPQVIDALKARIAQQREVIGPSAKGWRRFVHIPEKENKNG